MQMNHLLWVPQKCKLAMQSEHVVSCSEQLVLLPGTHPSNSKDDVAEGAAVKWLCGWINACLSVVVV
jgi:hypothetical protein